jgi:hypothetical protein
VKAFEGLDGDGFVSIDQVRRRFPSIEICKSLVQPNPVEEEGEGEDCLLPVICMGQLHNGIVGLEELVDNFWVLKPVEDGDDSNVSNKIFRPNRGDLIAETFPTLLDCLSLPSSNEMVTSGVWSSRVTPGKGDYQGRRYCGRSQ